MPNFIEIGWEIREKSRDADGGKEKKRKNKKNNKKHNKNRKVFRLCRQTLNIDIRQSSLCSIRLEASSGLRTDGVMTI